MDEGEAPARRNASREGMQVLFMDYLTCLGYNPPKASIRIIASSSSRLRGRYRLPFRDPSLFKERRGIRRLRHRRGPFTHLPVATCHASVRTHLFFLHCSRGPLWLDMKRSVSDISRRFIAGRQTSDTLSAQNNEYILSHKNFEYFTVLNK